MKIDNFIKIKEEKRPWGNFREFVKNEKATVKILTIQPNEELSLQSHHQRQEFWRILSGAPTIQIGAEKIMATAGEEFFIQREIQHRAIAGAEKTEILEISFGEFSENDEIRVEDKYGRV